jgi:hypothetical protein
LLSIASLGVIAVAVVAVVRMQRASRVHAADAAYASLFKCLLGPPLEADEQASGRMRRIDLGDPPSSWPSRCTRYSDRLCLAVREIEASWVCDFDAQGFQSSPDHFDAFWTRKLEVSAPADVESAPPPVSVADDRMRPLVPDANLVGASTDPVPGGYLRLLTGSYPGELCVAPPPLATFACTPAGFPSSPDQHALWPGSEDDGPALHSETRADWGSFPIQDLNFGSHHGIFCSKTLMWPEGCTAFGQRDGTVLVVSRATKGQGQLAYGASKDVDFPVVDIKMTLASSVDGPRLFGDRLFWTQRGSDGQAHLMSRRIGLGEPSVPAIEDLGDTPGQPVGACFTRDAMVVHGGMGDEHSFVLFVRDGRPSSLRPLAFSGLGAHRSAERQSVACGIDDVIFAETVPTEHPNAPRIGWTRCTEAGCGATETVELDAMLSGSRKGEYPRREEDVRAIGLGGKLVVLWLSAERGVRFRIDAPSRIEHAPDHLAYDDLMVGGTPSSMSLVFDFMLRSRHDAAVLLLATMDGTNRGIKAIRIAPDGNVTALTAQSQ